MQVRCRHYTVAGAGCAMWSTVQTIDNNVKVVHGHDARLLYAHSPAGVRCGHTVASR